MCFAPQRCALFRHLNFQKWSENGVFCTFWLGNVLRATTACTFSTSQLPKVVRTWCVLCATTACNFSSLIWPAGSAPAALASLLFDPRSHKSLEKHSVSRLSCLFAHLHLLSLTLSLLLFSLLIFLFSLPLPYSAFHLSILSEVWLLNFLRLIPFLGGWTFIYQLFWGSLGTRVLTHPQINDHKWSKEWCFFRQAAAGELGWPDMASWSMEDIPMGVMYPHPGPFHTYQWEF